MLIRYWMSKPAITIERTESMQQAIKLMKENRIKLLPVLDKQKLCGIITDRDLKRASASDATSLDVHELLYLISKIKVSDIMTHDVVSVHPDWTMEEAADLLLDRKISGAPVVDDHGHLCGVITQTDIFRATVYITGLRKRGLHMALVLEDTPDRLWKSSASYANSAAAWPASFPPMNGHRKVTATSTFDSTMSPGTGSKTC